MPQCTNVPYALSPKFKLIEVEPIHESDENGQIPIFASSYIYMVNDPENGEILSVKIDADLFTTPPANGSMVEFSFLEVTIKEDNSHSPREARATGIKVVPQEN